jgi:addiction module HigA family antidote
MGGDFMVPRKRKPTTPGEILQEDYLSPLGLTQKELADHIGYDVKAINRLINGRTGVTAPLALKLAAALNTTPEFWLNAQKAVDIYEASRRMGRLPTMLIMDRHLAHAWFR